MKALRLWPLTAVLFAVLCFTGSASAGVLPSLASGNLKGRFAILSQRHTNRCNLTPAELAAMPATGRLQGSCCGPMKYSDYVKQVNGLKAYAGADTIPPDPYDVSVALAKHLIYLDRQLTLTPTEQEVYNQATKMAEEHGPCCCRCWRWFAFQGQAKQFIRLRRYSAAQIAQIWDLEDGCGSGSMMMG
jgi:hypothetical protein